MAPSGPTSTRLQPFNIIDMANETFNVGDTVIVSAVVTGTGESIEGYITDIDHCLGSTFLLIKYYGETSVGDRGCCVSNLSLITKKYPNEQK